VKSSENTIENSNNICIRNHTQKNLKDERKSINVGFNRFSYRFYGGLLIRSEKP